MTQGKNTTRIRIKVLGYYVWDRFGSIEKVDKRAVYTDTSSGGEAAIKTNIWR